MYGTQKNPKENLAIRRPGYSLVSPKSPGELKIRLGFENPKGGTSLAEKAALPYYPS